MASQEGTNQDQMVDAGIDLRSATKSIWETLSEDPQMAGFLEMFRKLGIDAYLRGPDNSTVFAPQGLSADALAGREDEELESVLRSHILGRAVTLDELRTTTGVETIEKTSLTVERNGQETTVNGVRIVRPDIPCTNGVVHVVERPLMEA